MDMGETKEPALGVDVAATIVPIVDAVIEGTGEKVRAYFCPDCNEAMRFDPDEETYSVNCLKCGTVLDFARAAGVLVVMRPRKQVRNDE